MMCKEGYGNSFYFQIFFLIVILSFFTGYPLAYLSYGATSRYQLLPFGLVFMITYGFVIAVLFILFGYYAPFCVIVEKERVIIKTLFKRKEIWFRDVREVCVVIPYRKYSKSKDPSGILFVLKDNKEIFTGATKNKKLIHCLVEMVRERNLNVYTKQYLDYEGHYAYEDYPV